MVNEDDYNFLQRIHEYACRKWKEPLVSTYLWDKYGLNVKPVNRQRLLCRCDETYVYDGDLNLRIIVTVNTTSPFVNQIFRVNATAYNKNGDIEPGHLVLYRKYEDETVYSLYTETPVSERINQTKDFSIIVKYYTPDESSYEETIDPDDEVNISDTINIHVRDYTDADYFVSKDGDDTARGSLKSPFKTIQHALNIIASGDTICLLTDINDQCSNIIYTDCNIIAKNTGTTINSNIGLFFILFMETSLYIQDIVLMKSDKTVYDYKDGAYYYNYGENIDTIESEDIKPAPAYNFSISTDNYWISGETTNIIINGDLNEQAYVFDSLNNLVGVINSTPTTLPYTVPYGLNTDKITIVVPCTNTTYSTEFKVYNITTDWYVDTVNGNNDNTGRSLKDAFKSLDYCVKNALNVDEPSIFFIGEELLDNLLISVDETSIRGVGNNSMLKTKTDYIQVDTNTTLYLHDLFLDNNRVEYETVVNKGSYPVTLITDNESVHGALYVNGNTGSDSNTGASWSKALKTINKALEIGGVDTVYFSGENTINTPLHIIYETVKIVGSMTTQTIHASTGQYFTIDTGQVLELLNLSLDSAHITHNTYKNIGSAKMEVIT
jgi:hypothetical protein